MPMMPRRRAGLAALVVAIFLTPGVRSASAQAPQPAATQATPGAQEDPLRRETPRGAFLGFLEASQRGNRGVAAEYLQWPRQKMPVSKAEAAEQLLFVLNHGFEGNLDRLSRDAGGNTSDGLAPDRERAGTAVLANGERVDIFLSRVAQQGTGPAVWLVAADTVADIPRLYQRAGLPELERRLPKILTSASFGELQLWVPLALLVLVPLLYAVSKLFLWTIVEIYLLVFKWRGLSVPLRRSRGWRALSRPSAFLITLGLHRLISPLVGIPLLHRQVPTRARSPSCCSQASSGGSGAWWTWWPSGCATACSWTIRRRPSRSTCSAAGCSKV